MNILQIGPQNWADQYSLPKDFTWEFNEFPPKKRKYYQVVIITGTNSLYDGDWKKLQWQVDPYNVICLKSVKSQLTPAAQHFLKCQAAFLTTDKPQKIIDNLPRRFFFGQSGIRFSPTSLIPLMDRLESYEVLDEGHILLGINTSNQWQSIGTYKLGVFLDPKRLIKFWLEYQAHNVQLRLRVFIQGAAGDGDPKDNFILPVNSLKEEQLPINFVDARRYAGVSLEVKGQGQLKLGVLHSRWARDGQGEFIAGGQRIVNPTNREDIAYYFNPGDLRPPLNIYFSGARSLEGFEAYPLFRGLHAPTILFTDMRLEIGQFYTTKYMEEKIKAVICDYLKQLGFDKSQLIMNGISMGTYPAMKLGAQLQAYAINVAKPLANLGLIAKRGQLERPDSFETIFDIDNQLVAPMNRESLTQLDRQFWQDFNQTDLTQTRLFVAYMANDDYDNQAINYFRKSPAVANARQFSCKGFAGRHNDDPNINYWFMGRLSQMLKHDFGRKDL